MNKGRNKHRYKQRAHIRKLHRNLLPAFQRVIVTLRKECTGVEIKPLHDALFIFNNHHKWIGIK